MLVGQAIYKGHKIELQGTDLSSFMLFNLSARDYSTVDMFDDLTNSAGRFERSMQINPTTCKSDIPNKEFNCVFSATLRYAKANCYSKYRDMLFEKRQDIYTPEKASIYNIPNLGVVKVTFGFITEVKIETSNIKISLKEEDYDSDTEGEIFSQMIGDEFKSIGVKLTRDVLGFEPYVQSNTTSSNSEGFYESISEIIKNNPLKDYKWLLDRNYIIVDDSNLEEICERFMKTEKKIAFDTETTGLNITFKSRYGQADVLVGVILCDTLGESYYFPLQNRRVKNLCGGDHEYVMGKYIKPILESKRIVCHNTSFDWKVAHIYDINANIVDDTMIAIQCTLGYRYKNYPSSLGAITKTFLGRDSLELSDLVTSSKWGEGYIKFWDLPYELVRLYGCADGDNTLEMDKYIEEVNLLGNYGARKIYEIEVQFAKAVGYQEFYGHRVDVDEIPQLESDNDKIMAKSYQKMKASVGYDFNPNSSQQMQRILYEELGLPTQYKFDKGKRKVTCDKDARKRLMDMEDDSGDPLYPIVYYYQDYCDAKTIKSNFLNNLPTLATEDGYLHSGVGQLRTTTGRISTKDPNYQGYNDPVKKRIAPRPGFYMTDCDFNSIEYRVLACLSGQEQLIKAFYDPDLNYHTYQAARIFSVAYEAVTESLRKRAKGVNFGLPYGMEDPSLGAAVFGAKTPENTRKAASVRVKYFEGQEKVKDFFERVRDGGVANGYTSTYYGRRRYYDKSRVDVGSIRRQAGNAVIQGTAADIYKIGVVTLFAEICERNWLGKVLLPNFVHDETVAEVHKSINPMVWLKVVKEAFELKVEGWCPLYIGFGFGENWYESKSKEIPLQLQSKWCELYGDRGYPEWNGNTREFCDWVVREIDDYERNVVIDFITEEENKGKIITPTVNSFLSKHSKIYLKKYHAIKTNTIKQKNLTSLVTSEELKKYVHDDKKMLMGDIEPKEILQFKAEYLAKYVDEKGFIEKLLEHDLDTKIYTDIVSETQDNYSGYALEGIYNTKDTQVNLDIFCYMLDLDRDKIEILSTPKVEDKKEIQDDDTCVETEEDIRKRALELRLSRVKTLGLCIDTNNKVVILKLLNNNSIMSLIQTKLNREGRGYRVQLFNFEENKLYDTTGYLTSQKVSEVQQIYMTASYAMH